MTVKIVMKDGTTQLLKAYLLAKSAYAPKWQKKCPNPSKHFHKTKTGKVLSILMSGEQLTTYEAVLDLGILFLPAVISRLQKLLGISVEREWIHKTTAEETIKYKRYWLSPETTAHLKGTKFH